MRSLQGRLTSELGPGPALVGRTLQEATDISTDGSSILGWGLNPNGQPEAWRTVAGPLPVPLLLFPGGLAVTGRQIQAVCG